MTFSQGISVFEDFRSLGFLSDIVGTASLAIEGGVILQTLYPFRVAKNGFVNDLRRKYFHNILARLQDLCECAEDKSFGCLLTLRVSALSALMGSLCILKFDLIDICLSSVKLVTMILRNRDQITKEENSIWDERSSAFLLPETRNKHVTFVPILVLIISIIMHYSEHEFQRSKFWPKNFH